MTGILSQYTYLTPHADGTWTASVPDGAYIGRGYQTVAYRRDGTAHVGSPASGVQLDARIDRVVVLVPRKGKVPARWVTIARTDDTTVTIGPATRAEPASVVQA